MQITQDIQRRIDTWLSDSYVSEDQDVLRQLIENNETDILFDSFYKDLDFGTGGMRGKMGPGTNRMNKFTLGMAAQGYAEFLVAKNTGNQISIAISHDNRLNSRFFAELVADVISANGIKVYLFEDLRPTPELSFAIRYLGCKGGVMLTASHNPKEYNGFKAYGEDGGQLVSPDDIAVINRVRSIEDISQVKFEGNKDLIKILGTDVDNAYISAIVEKSLSPEAIKSQKDLCIVYSPIHGTGSTIMKDALEAFGFENVNLVEEQMQNDGNFPTVIYPNPEEEEAMTLALQRGKQLDADLVMATDPDADRVGIAIKNDEGVFELANGNQMASLITYYLIKRLDELGQLRDNMFVVNTIVTSNLIDKICADYNVECYNTLTGFKHIGRLITELEGSKEFIGGGEESYGYLVSDLVRDKDAIISACFVAELSAYFAEQGKTIYDAMIQMYQEHGLYRERLISLKKEGKQGADEIKLMLDNFRANPPYSFAGSKVIRLKDFLSHEDRDIVSGNTEKLNLPTSNVLQFITEEGDVISARPSGTEPKIKFYISVHQDYDKSLTYQEQKDKLEERIDRIEKELLS